MSLINKRVLTIITGASRGFGKVLTTVLAENVATGSAFIMMASNEMLLLETKEELRKYGTSASKAFYLDTIKVDLSVVTDDAMSTFKGSLTKSLTSECLSKSQFDVALIIHNAGSTGDLKLALEMTDCEELKSYFNVNLISAILINKIAFDLVKSISSKQYIVNISSLLAITPITTQSLYCTGKAAREMFFATLALENESVRVISYEPGLMETDLVRNMLAKRPEKADRFAQLKASGSMVDPAMTAKNLVAILDKDTFKSGGHVDVHDPL